MDITTCTYCGHLICRYEVAHTDDGNPYHAACWREKQAYEELEREREAETAEIGGMP